MFLLGFACGGLGACGLFSDWGFGCVCDMSSRRSDRAIFSVAFSTSRNVHKSRALPSLLADESESRWHKNPFTYDSKFPKRPLTRPISFSRSQKTPENSEKVQTNRPKRSSEESQT